MSSTRKTLSDKRVPQGPALSIIHLHSMPPVQTQDMTLDWLHSILRASESGQWEGYLALLRDITSGDAAVSADWFQRKTKLISKPWGLTPGIKDHPDAVANAAFIDAMLKGCRGFQDACTHLLDSTIFPVAVCEKLYVRAGQGWRLAELVPVPHDLLAYQNGYLQIRVTTPDGVPTGQFADLDPMRYVIHRGHLLRSLPDCWGGPGRALVFFWYLAAVSRSWWARGLERDSAPFLVGKYDPARPEDRYALAQAFQDAVRRFGLVISRDTDIAVHKDLASGSAEAHERFQNFCLSMCSRLIVGQSQTTIGKGGGFGDAQANVMDDVLTNIVAFDDMMLGETLGEQVIQPALDLNRRPGPRPIISRGVTPDNMVARANIIKVLRDAGVNLRPEAAGPISESLGLPVEIGAPVAKLASPSHRGGPADLALAFRGSLAPVRRLIEESTSADDLAARLADFYRDWDAGRLAALTADALTAFALA